MRMGHLLGLLPEVEEDLVVVREGPIQEQQAWEEELWEVWSLAAVVVGEEDQGQRRRIQQYPRAHSQTAADQVLLEGWGKRRRQPRTSGGEEQASSSAAPPAAGEFSLNF